MHLDLTDGPFVLHNLISAQECPVPVPKFQMTPILKILMPSLKKSWQVNPLQVPQQNHYGERYPLTGHFYISLDISL